MKKLRRKKTELRKLRRPGGVVSRTLVGAGFQRPQLSLPSPKLQVLCGGSHHRWALTGYSKIAEAASGSHPFKFEGS